MAEVTKVGLDVFSSIEKLKLWLNTTSYALGKLSIRLSKYIFFDKKGLFSFEAKR